MELPVKMELPKLSHLHILEILSPLVPGILVITGLALADSPFSQRFWNIGLGYKGKIALAVALSYSVGLRLYNALEMVHTSTSPYAGLNISILRMKPASECR